MVHPHERPGTQPDDESDAIPGRFIGQNRAGLGDRIGIDRVTYVTRSTHFQMSEKVQDPLARDIRPSPEGTEEAVGRGREAEIPCEDVRSKGHCEGLGRATQWHFESVEGSIAGQEPRPAALRGRSRALPPQFGRSSRSSTRSCDQLPARVMSGAIVPGLIRVAMSGWKCTVVPVVPSSETGVGSVVGTPCS